MSDNPLTSPERGKKQAAKVQKEHPEMKPSNGHPPGPLERIRQLYQDEREAQKQCDQAHEVYQQAKGRLDKRRHEMELYIQSLCESRPLYDRIPEEQESPLKGEPIGPLGITERALDNAYLHLSRDKKSGLAIVQPFTLSARPHVVIGKGYEETNLSLWDCRPLYTEGAFTTKYPAVELHDNLAAGSDPYVGLRVQVGKLIYVLGSRVEQRRLIQGE
jgi:hypothetical protein